VKFGDSGETLLIQCTANENRQESSAAHFTTQKSVTTLSRRVENFSIAQSSTAFLNNSKSTNSWDNRITEEDIILFTEFVRLMDS